MPPLNEASSVTDGCSSEMDLSVDAVASSHSRLPSVEPASNITTEDSHGQPAMPEQRRQCLLQQVKPVEGINDCGKFNHPCKSRCSRSSLRIPPRLKADSFRRPHGSHPWVLSTRILGCAEPDFPNPDPFQVIGLLCADPNGVLQSPNLNCRVCQVDHDLPRAEEDGHKKNSFYGAEIHQDYQTHLTEDLKRDAHLRPNDQAPGCRQAVCDASNKPEE